MSNQTTPATVDLSARFLRAKLSITCWGNTRQAKEVAADAESRAGAEVGKSLNVGKILLDKLALEPVTKSRSALVAQHKAITGIWDESSWRLLPTVRYFEYMEKMNPLISDFQRAADELEARYLDLVDEAKARLNGLYCDDDYPGETQFRQKFTIKTQIDDIAPGDTSRINLPQSDLDKIQEQMQSSYADSLKTVQADQWKRLLDVVTKLRDSLISYDKGQKTKAAGGEIVKGSGEQSTVRQTLIESIDKVCSDIPDFNVLADPALIASIEEIKRDFASIDMSEVRESPILRTETISKAAAATEKLKARSADLAGFMG